MEEPLKDEAVPRDWDEVFEHLADCFAVGHYARTTRSSYLSWIRGFRAYLSKTLLPAEVDSSHAAAYLTYLARGKNVSASTQNQAFSALLFLFRKVLRKEFKPEGVERAKRRKYVPQTLTCEEIEAVAAALPDPYRLLVKLLYGCGLRLTETLNLRVHNFDFDMGVLTIHRGKGQKDRTVPLPEVLRPELVEHLRGVREGYEADLEKGFDGAFMPQEGAPGRWSQRAMKWAWQFFFPAKRLTVIPGTGQRRRYHLHATHFSEQLGIAVAEVGLHKKVSAHTFRHSFASHLLLANYDIRTIQEMLGHSDVRTTMIYLQTVPSRTLKHRRSPLDMVVPVSGRVGDDGWSGLRRDSPVSSRPEVSGRFATPCQRHGEPEVETSG